MLRRVARVLRVGLLVFGVVFLAWIAPSFFIRLGARVPTPVGTLFFDSLGGHISLMHLRHDDDLSLSALVFRAIKLHPRLAVPWAIWPSYEVHSDYGYRILSLPLWLLAAICLAWPVTSLLLARRRRNGRGFAVEPAADAAPPAIDRPPHHPSNLPPP